MGRSRPYRTCSNREGQGEREGSDLDESGQVELLGASPAFFEAVECHVKLA
jgi:hypothetical protein